MHERSVVRNLIQQIEQTRDARQLGQLVKVRLAIGEFSGIEPALLATAFEEEALMHWGRTIQLDMELIPLQARCHSCNTTFRVECSRFLCPVCACAQVDLISGEELQLVSLTVEQNSNLQGMTR